MSENGTNRAREELFPIRAAHLVHALATHEQAVVITIAFVSRVIVINFETVTEQVLRGPLRLDGIVKTGVAEGEDAGARPAARAHIASVGDIVEGAVLALKTSANKA